MLPFVEIGVHGTAGQKAPICAEFSVGRKAEKVQDRPGIPAHSSFPAHEPSLSQKIDVTLVGVPCRAASQLVGECPTD